MIKRLNPYEGYRRSALLSYIFGTVVAKELTDKANEFCLGDIETLVKAGIYVFSKEVPIERVYLYLSIEDVSSFEESIPEGIKQLAKLKANELYLQYLEGMNK